MSSIRAVVCAVVLAAGVLGPARTVSGQKTALPTPASILGYEPGADRKLPTWKQITDYFTALDKASPRVTTRILGKTTLGRPFLAVFIADSSTLANLDRYKQIQRKLMDPRLRKPGELQQLLLDGKNVILITSSIHSTEVGGFTTPLVLADRLARGETADAKSVLANTIVILVPSQNPDGVDIVGDWYRSTLDTKSEGTEPPQLYHKYTGHDNNRESLLMNMPEAEAIPIALSLNELLGNALHHGHGAQVLCQLICDTAGVAVAAGHCCPLSLSWVIPTRENPRC